MKKLLIILGFPIWLPIAIALFAIIISLYASLFSLIVSFLVAAICTLISALIGGIGISTFFISRGNLLSGFAVIALGLICLGLSVLFAYATKMLLKFTKTSTIVIKLKIKGWIN